MFSSGGIELGKTVSGQTKEILRLPGQNMQLGVEHEHDNISGCNALKSEVLSDG